MTANIYKGDRFVEKSMHWTFWSPEHQYNECKETIVRYGTIVAKSKYGVLVQWDNARAEWINYNKINKSLGYGFYGMKSNTYTRYEKLK